MCEARGVGSHVTRERGAMEDVGSLDRHVVRCSQRVPIEYVESPVTIDTTVDQGRHDHRGIDDEGHRRS